MIGLEQHSLLGPIAAASQVNSVFMAAFSYSKVDGLQILQYILLTLPVSVQIQAIFYEFADFLFVFDSE